MIALEDQLKNKANFLDDEGHLYLVSCMNCAMENYSLNVANGICAWCGWPGQDTNEFVSSNDSKTSHKDNESISSQVVDD